MNTSFHQASAKIYQFPVGGRAAVSARLQEVKTTADINAPRISDVVCGSAWYHEAAIQDAKLTGEH